MYLGMLINYNWKFNYTHEKQLPCRWSLKKWNVPIYRKKLSFFDTYDGSVFNHGSEIWGFHNGKDVEKVQLEISIRCKKDYELCGS